MIVSSPQTSWAWNPHHLAEVYYNDYLISPRYTGVFEGLTQWAYVDSNGHITIGVGHKLNSVILHYSNYILMKVDLG